MSETSDYIKQRLVNHPKFAKALNQQRLNLDVSVAVAQLRTEKKLTQTELAKRIGESRATVDQLEQGQVDVTLGLLLELSAATNTELSVKFI